MCQYAALLHMFAQVNDMEVGEFVHVIADAHIYDKHVDLVEELITRKQYPAQNFGLILKSKTFMIYSR